MLSYIQNGLEHIMAISTAKVFATGNSQAVRLPKSFRLDTAEVWISRNEGTGEITLHPKPRPDELDAFFALLEAAPRHADEFVAPRDAAAAPDPFEGWDTERTAG